MLNNELENLKKQIEYLPDDIFAGLKNEPAFYFNQVVENRFVKICGCKNFHFDTLKNEIKVLTKYAEYAVFPRLIFTYASKQYAVLIEDRITGSPLSKDRNAFKTYKDIDIKEVLKQIEGFYRFPVFNDFEYLTYNQNEKIADYIDACGDILTQEIAESCRLINDLYRQNNIFFSHGDMILSNILLCGSDTRFVDWEWAGLRTKNYDRVMFLLFAFKPDYLVDRIAEYFKEEELQDAHLDVLQICLHEIKNWLSVPACIQSKNRLIKKWLRTLRKCIEWFNIDMGEIIEIRFAKASDDD